MSGIKTMSTQKKKQNKSKVVRPNKTINLNIPTASTNIGLLKFVINGRYVVTDTIETIIKDGENFVSYKINPKTILTVNRFENDIAILRWMAFDLGKFVEVVTNEEISKKLTNIM
jgi:hypothetical protein